MRRPGDEVAHRALDLGDAQHGGHVDGGRARLPVCGAASSFVAVSRTAYEPAGTPAATASVAVAVPPSAVAGAKPVRAIVPAAGAGVTEPIVSEVTVPSASVAETAAWPPSPACVGDRGRARHGDRRVVGRRGGVRAEPAERVGGEAVPLRRGIERVGAVRVAVGRPPPCAAACCRPCSRGRCPTRSRGRCRPARSRRRRSSPLRSATASSPLNHPAAVRLVGGGEDRGGCRGLRQDERRRRRRPSRSG